MTISVYVYDVALRVAVFATSEEEANGLAEQGKVAQLSVNSTLVSTTELPL